MSTEYVLIERSLAGIWRAAGHLYRTHFWTILLAYAVPILPFQILSDLAARNGYKGWEALLNITLVFLGMFVAGALTIIVGDICLGRQSNVLSVYKRMCGALLPRLLKTNVMTGLAIAFGILLLILPGLLFTFWYLLAPSVVVLEGRSGFGALKRSKSLVQGDFRRVALTLGILVCIFISGVFIPLLLIGMIAGLLESNGLLELTEYQLQTLGAYSGSALYVILFPISILVTVLLYYDLRVRREGYNNQNLATDLMH